MNDKNKIEPNVPHAAIVKEKSTPWLFWLLPIVALCIGLGLIFNYYHNRGVEVVMHLPYNATVQPGKTQVKLAGIPLGVVKSVSPSPNLSGVDAVVEFKKKAAAVLQKDTLFWLVQPKITASQVTGLDTLIQGNYIATQLGQDFVSQRSLKQAQKLQPQKFEYNLLAEPPPKPEYLGGIQLDIVSTGNVSLAEGAPLTYRKITIGEIDRVSLAKDGKSTHYRVYIKKPYKHLITPSSRFWNASGVVIKGSLSSFHVQFDSLISTLVGGIAMENVIDSDDSNANKGKVKYDQSFPLYADKQSAMSKARYINLTFDSGKDLAEEMPLKYNGIKIGQVSTIKFDDNLEKATVKVNIFGNMNKIAREGSSFWLVKPEVSLASIKNVDTLISGSYIAVKPGKGAMKQDFHALTVAPLVVGKNITLVSHSSSVLSDGAPLTYQKLAIGHILSHKITNKGKTVSYVVHVRKRYQDLVTSHSFFWNASGISVKGGITHFKVKMDSLVSLAMGGIAMGNPKLNSSSSPAKNNAHFKLYTDEESANPDYSYVNLRFDSADDLAEGMPLKYNGIQIGEITQLSFSKDLRYVFAKVRVEQAIKRVAKQGAQFWVVKAELGLVDTSHLDNLITGNYLNVRLGKGAKPSYNFVGLSHPPSKIKDDKRFYHVILATNWLGSIHSGTRVFYRNVAVGKVDGAELNNTATGVRIYVSIQAKYAPLIHQRTRFWNISGFKVNYKLWKGLTIETNSAESLMSGGIAFATPNNDQMGKAMPSGSYFVLEKAHDPSWLNWQPTIKLK